MNMGQAAQTVGGDVADFAMVRKRNRKIPGGTAGYTGNLYIYKQHKNSERATLVTDAATIRPALLDISALAANSCEHIEPARQNATSGIASLVSRHLEITAALFVLLATGVDVGSVLSVSEPYQPRQNASSVVSIANQSATDSLQQASSVSDSAIDPRIDDVQTALRLSSGYQEEIRQLHVVSKSLHEKKTALDEESVSLNQELLQLELQVAALQAEAQQFVEVRTIYNFIDAPAGGGDTGSENTDADDYAQSNDGSFELYYDSQSMQDAGYIPEDFVAPEEYFDPSIPGMGYNIEEFGTPFFN